MCKSHKLNSWPLVYMGNTFYHLRTYCQNQCYGSQLSLTSHKSDSQHDIRILSENLVLLNCTTWIMLQLLTEDSTPKPFKLYKQSAKKHRKIGDVLTVIVAAGTLSFYILTLLKWMWVWVFLTLIGNWTILMCFGRIFGLESFMHFFSSEL